MSRLSILEAPALILEQYKTFRDGDVNIEGDGAHAIEFSLMKGFIPEPPKTPSHDLVREATARGDFQALIAIRQSHAWRLMQETRAVERYAGIPAAWKQQPNDGEALAARREQAAAEAQQAAIERRAQEIMQDELQAARARAIAKAQAELQPAAPVASPAPAPSAKGGKR